MKTAGEGRAAEMLAESRPGLEGHPPVDDGGRNGVKEVQLGRWGTGGSGVRHEYEEAARENKQKRGGLLGFGRRTTRQESMLSQVPKAGAPDAAEEPAEPQLVNEDAADIQAEAEAEASGVPPAGRPNAVHGWVYKRGGLKSKGWRKRYCVYEPLTKRFTYYDSEDAARRDQRRKGRVRVTQSAVVNKASARSKVERRLSAAEGARKLVGVEASIQDAIDAAGDPSAKGGAKYEFKFNTAEGRIFELYVEKATELRVWLEAMPHWGEELTMGWLYKRKHGSKKGRFDHRYVVYDPSTKEFAYYATEKDAKMKREKRGSVTVTSTILYADRFAFYTSAGRFYECYAESADELNNWMDALPSPTGAKVEGWVYKHKRGAHSAKFQRRYATYEMETGLFNYFTDERRAVPKGRATVLYASPTTPAASSRRLRLPARAEPLEFTFPRRTASSSTSSSTAATRARRG